MSRYELERAVALATGESRREIRRRGFQPLVFGEDPSGGEFDAELGVVDWDQLAAERLLLFP